MIGTDDPTRTTINDDGEERVCGWGTILAFLCAVITSHGTMTLLKTTTSPGRCVAKVVQSDTDIHDFGEWWDLR